MRAAGYAFVLSILAGCASSPQQTPSALSTEYTGRPFVVRHTGPRFAGPATSSGGRITGQVCGVDITYEVTHKDGRVRLTGFLDGHIPSQLTVEERDGERVVSGALGTRPGTAAVDLHLYPGRLTGRVGFRRFDLVQQGDQLLGELRMAGTDEPTTATINGLHVMQGLSPADQAAILPTLLTCYVARIGNFGRSPLVVGFGGPPGADPHGSSSLYGD